MTMPNNPTSSSAGKIPLGALLAQLPRIELERKQMSQQLQDSPFENRLLSLTDISIDRETDGLREILAALKKIH
jgi:hypothetical protein